MDHVAIGEDGSPSPQVPANAQVPSASAGIYTVEVPQPQLPADLTEAKRNAERDVGTIEVIPFRGFGFPKRSHGDPRTIPRRQPWHIATIVLDLDETLVDARDPSGEIKLRPFARKLLDAFTYDRAFAFHRGHQPDDELHVQRHAVELHKCPPAIDNHGDGGDRQMTMTRVEVPCTTSPREAPTTSNSVRRPGITPSIAIGACGKGGTCRRKRPFPPKASNGALGRCVEIIVWSAGESGHVDRCLEILDPTGNLIDHAIHKDESWLPKDVVLKNLASLPGREGSSVIVDDFPLATVCNGTAAIIVPPFQPGHEVAANDTTLEYLIPILARAVRHYSHPEEAIKKGGGCRVDLTAPLFKAHLEAKSGGWEEAEAVGKSTSEQQAASAKRLDMDMLPRTLADFVSDHPFVNIQKFTVMGAELHVLYLDVADEAEVNRRNDELPDRMARSAEKFRPIAERGARKEKEEECPYGVCGHKRPRSEGADTAVSTKMRAVPSDSFDSHPQKLK